MKKSFKQIALVLAVIMSVSIFVVPCSVSAGSYAFDMNELGITAGMKPETRESEYVRRDEFAQMVVNMMMQQEAAKSLENAAYFTDIAASEYKGAINLLASHNYISGSGDGGYSPDGYLTYGAACKILVNALGYDKIVEDSSLESYQFVAGTIKLTSNIDASQQYMTFAQTMAMIDNALDIGLMVPTYYNVNIGPSYEVDEDRTYRSMLYGRNGTGIVKMRGVVTADISTYLYEEVPNLKNTQLQIEGKVYNYDGTAPIGYVGQIVDYYMTRKDFEDGKISAIEPLNKNAVYDFDGSLVTNVTSDEITYETNSIKTTVKVNESTRYIYNNRLDLSYRLSADGINDNVVLRTVDNDEDDIANVVFIYDYKNCRVKSLSAGNNVISFENGFELDGVKNLELDEEKIYYEIYDSKGNLTSFDSINEDSVLSIAKSKKGDSIRIVICDEKIEGIIVSRADDEVTIGDKDYLCADTVELDDVKIGSQVVAYMNFLGKIVYFEETDSAKTYGYVYMYTTPSGLGSYKIKMLMPASVSVKDIDGETNEMSGEVTKSKALYVRNSDVVVFDTETNIIFDGSKTKTTSVLPQIVDTPVAYAVNADGKIYKIDTLDAIDDIRITANAEESTSLYNKLYNGTELIFGGKKGNAFAIRADHTVAFCVPKYTEESQKKMELSDDDLKVMVELKDSLGYEANGYEQDDNTLISDVLVVQQIMQSGQTGNITDKSDVGMVLKSSKRIDADGNEVTAITMLTKGEEKTFNVSGLVPNQFVFERLNKGDLIAYSLDAFDRLNGVTVFQRANEYYEDVDTDYVCAYIKDIEYDRISNSKVRWVHNIKVGYENEDEIISTLEFLVRSPAPIFIMETENSIRIGNVNDLLIGDQIYAVLNLDKIRAIAVKRY